MNYLLGTAKIPRDFTVQQLKSAIKLLERTYLVKIGIAQIRELESTFFELKLKSNRPIWRRERIDVMIDANMKLYKLNRI